MEIPKIIDTSVTGKKVLVRADLEFGDRNSPRGRAADNIVAYLKEHGASKVKLIGHKGTPEMTGWWSEVEVNYDLRKDSREEENSQEYAKELSEGWDIYINEAFATSHRKHTSIDALPRVMKSQGKLVCLGPQFEKEIDNLHRIFTNPQKPVVTLISGLKEDKLSYVEKFLKFSDKILIGGRLPEYFKKVEEVSKVDQVEKIIVAQLNPDKEDITIHSIERFEEAVNSAGTIVVSGPLGKFEDEGHRQGTKRVFEAIVHNKEAFKVAGGGDTEKAISLLSLSGGFNWISTGGGAMLDFLANGTLPGIEALT
jgi:phosphoglycerate kinase